MAGELTQNTSSIKIFAGKSTLPPSNSLAYLITLAAHLIHMCNILQRKHFKRWTRTTENVFNQTVDETIAP